MFGCVLGFSRVPLFLWVESSKGTQKEKHHFGVPQKRRFFGWPILIEESTLHLVPRDERFCHAGLRLQPASRLDFGSGPPAKKPAPRISVTQAATWAN